MPEDAKAPVIEVVRCDDSSPQDLVPQGDAKRLEFPMVISQEDMPLRPERHIPSSIATIIHAFDGLCEHGGVKPHFRREEFSEFLLACSRLDRFAEGMLRHDMSFFRPVGCELF
jgi:hypothetical protein